MNRSDMARRGLKDGEVVDLNNDHDGRKRVARKFVAVEYSIPQGCAATYFPEGNVLVPVTTVADKSNTPASKQVIIKVTKHAGQSTLGRDRRGNDAQSY